MYALSYIQRIGYNKERDVGCQRDNPQFYKRKKNTQKNHITGRILINYNVTCQKIQEM